jgi:hypothetical protein
VSKECTLFRYNHALSYYGQDVVGTQFQDEWVLVWQDAQYRLLSICERLPSPLPENCTGGMRTSNLPYAPFVSDSKICYSADQSQEASCSAVPNSAHSRLCFCSAPCTAITTNLETRASSALPLQSHLAACRMMPFRYCNIHSTHAQEQSFLLWQ